MPLQVRSAPSGCPITGTASVHGRSCGQVHMQLLHAWVGITGLCARPLRDVCQCVPVMKYWVVNKCMMALPIRQG